MEKEDRSPSDLSTDEIVLIKRLAWIAARKYKGIKAHRYDTEELAAHAICHVLSNLKCVPKPLKEKGDYIYRMQCYSIISYTLGRRRPDNFSYYKIENEDKEEVLSYIDKEELRKRVRETLNKTLNKFTGAEREILDLYYVDNKDLKTIGKETGKKWQGFARLIRRFKLAFIEEWEKE